MLTAARVAYLLNAEQSTRITQQAQIDAMTKANADLMQQLAAAQANALDQAAMDLVASEEAALGIGAASTDQPAAAASGQQ